MRWSLTHSSKKSDALTFVPKSKLSARQRGDFQTPEELARRVWQTLNASQFDLVIEPTFGLGSFLTAMPDACRANVIGWEIHEDYYRTTKDKLLTPTRSTPPRLIHGDVFTVSREDIKAAPTASVLVIGNPPWVTNSEQSTLGGDNTGKKYNLKNLPGFDAMTGKSNFDISEAIILRFVNLLMGHCRFAQFALLTKFSVLKNLIRFLASHPCIGDFEFHQIDAAQYFNAAVNAGLLKFKIGGAVPLRQTCTVYRGIGGEKIGEVAMIDGRLIYDLATYERTAFVENKGRGAYMWRQGVKHDLSKVMELRENADGLHNGFGEKVEIEESVLYQLYKSSDLYHARGSRYVVPVYQRNLKDTLDDLPDRFPKLHRYLTKHKILFDKRQSSIYKNRPAFSIFGVGDYTHLKYKVAIGSLYTKPVFQLLEPTPRPVVVDDTGYMIATDDYDEAVYVFAVLSLDCVKQFLLSVSHASDKRRFSKEVLARVFIPPMHECPLPIRTAIADSWVVNEQLSIDVKKQMQDWLSDCRITTAIASSCEEKLLVA